MDCMRNRFTEGALLDGRFRTISPLNHGSFGMVFKAFDTWTGEFVALKCLTKSTAAIISQQTLAVDDRSEELSIHRIVGSHRNVVNLIHHFETEHHIYLVLEYCANGDLYEAIRLGRGPGQTEHVRECMLQLVDAVEHMHSMGIYHRDIKPENIFLSSSGAMKLGDFGLATMDSWSFESAVGSDRYMAPEQFDPQNTGYSPAKADVWALGICLLNMLFSRNPFAQPSPSDPLFADFASDRQTLFDVFPSMSQDTFEVLMHCLAVDPTKRSLAAMKNALKRAVVFTTDDESLDEFCAEETVAKVTASAREPLRTPSLSAAQFDDNGAFMWAKNLPMSPPLRQLSAIPDEYSEDLFPSSEDTSSKDWFSVKPDNESVVSFVDSGLGVSLKSTNLKAESADFNRSRPVAISGSLPASLARPIRSMSSVFGKKRELVSKSWSDLWDEDEELAQGRSPASASQEAVPAHHDWLEEAGGRATPRNGLAELPSAAAAHNSRDRTPAAAAAARALDDRVSQHTGFIFEEDDAESTPRATPATPALPSTPRYTPPKRNIVLDQWAALGERRRAAPLSPVEPAAPPTAPPQPRKRPHPPAWRRWPAPRREPWISKDWRRQQADPPAREDPPLLDAAVAAAAADKRAAFEWVWRSGGLLHL